MPQRRKYDFYSPESTKNQKWEIESIEITRTSENNPMYYSAEAELSEMIQKANDKGYKVLVGIDDIAKTPEMVKFLSIWGAMLLGVDEDESVRLAKFTCGYAYAYQVLGSLYFDRQKNEKWDDIISKFDRIVFGDSYDLIWKSLIGAEQEFVRCIVNSDSGKAAEIKAKMSYPKGYDSLRQRIRNKHLINTEDRGYIKINLPRFKEYVKLWQSGE